MHSDFSALLQPIMASPILAGKLEAEIKIKSDPDEFFHSFGGKAHKLPNLCSDKVHGVKVHQGDWKTKGSVKLWTYAIGSKNQLSTL